MRTAAACRRLTSFNRAHITCLAVLVLLYRHASKADCAAITANAGASHSCLAPPTTHMSHEHPLAARASLRPPRRRETQDTPCNAEVDQHLPTHTTSTSRPAMSTAMLRSKHSREGRAPRRPLHSAAWRVSNRECVRQALGVISPPRRPAFKCHANDRHHLSSLLAASALHSCHAVPASSLARNCRRSACTSPSVCITRATMDVLCHGRSGLSAEAVDTARKQHVCATPPGCVCLPMPSSPPAYGSRAPRAGVEEQSGVHEKRCGRNMCHSAVAIICQTRRSSDKTCGDGGNSWAVQVTRLMYSAEYDEDKHEHEHEHRHEHEHDRKHEREREREHALSLCSLPRRA